jgi:hypothetical protein
VIDTPEGIQYVRLASLKGMLKLEHLGMTSRGGALRPRLAAEFGLKPRDSHAKFIAYCEKKMAEFLANRQGVAA